MSDLLCPACGAEEAAPVLCVTCTDKARRDLDSIGRMRRQLDPMPRRGRGGKAPGKPGSRPPANLHVLAMTDVRSHARIDPVTWEHDVDDVANVDNELVTEARLVIEAKQLHHPLRDAFDAIRVVNIHLDWCCRSPRADEFAAVLSSCAHGLRQVMHDTEPSVGRCPAAHATRTACGGPLRLAWEGDLPADPDEQVAPTHVVCGWCRDAWPLDASTLLGMLRVVKPRAFPVSRTWAAETLGINETTLRVWVHRGHVQGYADGQVNLMDLLRHADAQ